MPDAGALGLHWPAPRGMAVTWPRCQAGERPPSRPWHRCPLQTPGLSWCQQLSGLSCAQAAGGQPVKGPCPPSLLGTPLIQRNVCVCVLFIPSRGKNSLSAEFFPGPRCWLPDGILGVGPLRGPPPLSLPTALRETTGALQGVPCLGGCEDRGDRAGWGVRPTASGPTYASSNLGSQQVT